MPMFCVDNPKYFSISEGKHRYQANAKTFIPRGTVITRNKPLASTLNFSYRSELCSYCFEKPAKLFQCSLCKITKYCNRNCQKRDYPFHKSECSAMRSTIPVDDERALLLRVRATLRKLSPDCVCETYNAQGIGLVQCGRNHWQQMSKAPRALVATTQQSPSTDCLETLAKFQANNFGIQNHLWDTVGQGVYPHAAILNHSCNPNCFLRYRGTLMEIVALRDIPHGEELTHSYVDLAKDTLTRQQHFKSLHGFTCDCQRCRGQVKVSLQKQWIDSNPPALYDWVIRTRNPYDSLSIQPTKCLEIDVETLCITTPTNKDNVDKQAVINRSLDLRQQAAFVGDAEGQSLLTQSVDMLEASLSPFSVELYSCRGELLSSLLLEENYTSARNQCKGILAFLLVVFPPYHPMIGLQLFTMADLTMDPDKRNLMYRWTRDIVMVSHGANHEFLKRLDEVLY